MEITEKKEVIFQPYNTRAQLMEYLNVNLGEKYISFVQSKVRTNVSDKLIHNWNFIAKPIPQNARVFTDEFKKLVMDTYSNASVDHFDNSIPLTTSRWLEMINRCKEEGINMTRENEFESSPLTTHSSPTTTTTDVVRSLINQKGKDHSQYTEEELALLRAYEGAGGQASEGEEILTQFFTPGYVCEIMWKIARHFGYKGGLALDPAIGTARFAEHVPAGTQLVGIEPDPIAATIAQLLYPETTILEGMYFEQAFLQPKNEHAGKAFVMKYVGGEMEGYPHPPSKTSWLGEFDIVIGNPPYGKFQNQYSGYFKHLKIAQLEHFFILKSLELVKPNGLLIFLIPSNFMRNGMSYQGIKEKMLEKSTLLACYRLPNSKDTFENTGVGGDILVLRKK